jgi:hypothetical protein
MSVMVCTRDLKGTTRPAGLYGLNDHAEAGIQDLITNQKALQRELDSVLEKVLAGNPVALPSLTADSTPQPS